VELEALLMNPNEMRNAGYPVHPLHDDGLPDPEFVHTPSNAEQSSGERTVIGMDCEMCRTDQGMEGTRVTLVDYQGNTLFDQLVKPANPILDYLTTYLPNAISLIIDGLV
jgi:RNA exonuclease 1